MEAYYWDRLEGAYELAIRLGVGETAQLARFYRLVEGEHLTRKSAVQEKIADWLTLEYVPGEAGDPEQLSQRIVAACDAIAQRLGWTHGPGVMVSVLLSDVDAPWAAGRFGYFVDKYPYDKICIPYRSAHDPDYLHETVMHEYAHCIVLNLAQGHAPRWLNEAVAMVAQGGADRQAVAGFVRGEIPWQKLSRVSTNFIAEEQGAHALWHAYQQSACIGAYLVSLKGERGLGDLLRAFSDNSVLQELKMRVTNQPPADEALRQTYGFGEEDLFDLGLEWLKSQPSP